jgi:Tfp pilus assembly PilM family ATPase
MAKFTIGVDISGELISAVVVSDKGREVQVVDCAAVELEKYGDVRSGLQALLEQLQYQGGRCVSGLSLSCFSLRNLVLPFTSEKKIEQILPLELEEHLLVPVDEQIFAAKFNGTDERGTRLLVAAVEKNILARHLEDFSAAGLDPERVCPSSFVLAEYLNTGVGCSENFVLLYGDMGSMTLVVCHQGGIVFMRRLSYPEAVFTDALFSFTDNGVQVRDQAAAASAVLDLCAVGQQSMAYFSFTGKVVLKPEFFVLAGPMQLGP